MTQPVVHHNETGVPESHAVLPIPPNGVTTPAVQTTTLTQADVLTTTRVEDTTEENLTKIQGGEQNLTLDQLVGGPTTNLREGPTLICRLQAFHDEALRVHRKVQSSLHRSRHLQRRSSTKRNLGIDLNHTTSLVS